MQRIGTGAVIIKEVKPVLVTIGLVTLCEDAVCLPGIVTNADFLAIRPHNSEEAHIGTGVWKSDVPPLRSHICRQMNCGVRQRGSMIYLGCFSHIHHGNRPVTEVQRVRQAINIRFIIDQKVIERVIAGAICTHGVDQFVDAYAIDERQAWVTQSCHVFKGGRVVNEPTLQAGNE